MRTVSSAAQVDGALSAAINRLEEVLRNDSFCLVEHLEFMEAQCELQWMNFRDASNEERWRFVYRPPHIDGTKPVPLWAPLDSAPREVQIAAAPYAKKIALKLREFAANRRSNHDKTLKLYEEALDVAREKTAS